MARGNDSQAALVDLRGEYGATSGNAEDLIAAQKAAITPEIRHAQTLPRDEEGTEDVQGRLDEIGSKLGKDVEVADAAVRGPYVFVRAISPSGRSYPVVLPYSDLGGKRKLRPSEKAAAQENEDLSAEHEATLERMQVQADAAAAEREAEKAADEARAKARESAQSKRAKESDKS